MTVDVQPVRHEGMTLGPVGETGRGRGGASQMASSP